MSKTHSSRLKKTRWARKSPSSARATLSSSTPRCRKATANERLQAFEGIIARRNRGFHSSFTVRKISYGEGVERVFPVYSPHVAKIEVKRRGDVRRAKLYYPCAICPARPPASAKRSK